MNKKNKIKLLQTTTIILLITTIILSYFLFTNNNNKSDFIINLNKQLTKDEQLSEFNTTLPRITYISLPYLQANQDPFFNQAKVGDYLIEYPGAIVIYRTKTDTIINIYKPEAVPNDLIEKIHQKPDYEALIGTQPSVIRINQQNYEQIAQLNEQINQSMIGNYLLDYTEFIIIYDYDNDIVKKIIELNQNTLNSTQNNNPNLEQLPTDFFNKLLNHPELTGYEDASPQGGKVNQEIINQLQQTYSNYYQNIQPGDYLLRYTDKIIVYNYETDTIKEEILLQ